MSVTQKRMREIVLQRYPRLFCKLREEFDGRPGLWFSGELTGDGSDIASDGRRLFDYYCREGDQEDYIFGVHPEINALLEAHGWWFEWYDCGTLMAHKD